MNMAATVMLFKFVYLFVSNLSKIQYFLLLIMNQ